MVPVIYLTIMAGAVGLIMGLLCAYLVYRLHKIFNKLEEQITEYEAIKTRSRQTGATMAGLEDAMASLIAVQYNRNIEQVRLDATLRMLQQMRQGPYEYQSKPTGKRKDFK